MSFIVLCMWRQSRRGYEYNNAWSTTLTSSWVKCQILLPFLWVQLLTTCFYCHTVKAMLSFKQNSLISWCLMSTPWELIVYGYQLCYNILYIICSKPMLFILFIMYVCVCSRKDALFQTWCKAAYNM